MESSDGHVPVLSLHGEFDIAACEPLEKELTRVSEAGPETVVIDLSNLEFMDSSGLRTLLQSDAVLREAGSRLVLVRGGPPVQRVFQITRTDDRLDFVDSSEDVSGDGAGDPGRARA